MKIKKTSPGWFLLILDVWDVLMTDESWLVKVFYRDRSCGALWPRFQIYRTRQSAGQSLRNFFSRFRQIWKTLSQKVIIFPLKLGPDTTLQFVIVWLNDDFSVREGFFNSRRLFLLISWVPTFRSQNMRGVPGSYCCGSNTGVVVRSRNIRRFSWFGGPTFEGRGWTGSLDLETLQ